MGQNAGLVSAAEMAAVQTQIGLQWYLHELGGWVEWTVAGRAEWDVVAGE